MLDCMIYGCTLYNHRQCSNTTIWLPTREVIHCMLVEQSLCVEILDLTQQLYNKRLTSTEIQKYTNAMFWIKQTQWTNSSHFPLAGFNSFPTFSFFEFFCRFSLFTRFMLFKVACKVSSPQKRKKLATLPNYQTTKVTGEGVMSSSITTRPFTESSVEVESTNWKLKTKEVMTTFFC